MPWLDGDPAAQAERARYQGNGSDPLPPITSAPEPPWPEPLSRAAYYGLVGECVDLVAPATESDPAALLFHLLGFTGAFFGRDAWTEVEATQHHCNLFLAVVGETAKARKGTAAGWVRRLFVEIAPLWVLNNVASGLSSGEGLIHHVRDPIFKQTEDGEKCVDEGVPDKRLVVIEEEFARPLTVMQRKDNTLSTILRTAWDATARLQVMTRKDPLKATGALISLIGHITIEELRRKLTDTEIANGFGNRVLWCCARRTKLLPLGGNIDTQAMQNLVGRFKLALGALPRGKIGLNAAAAQRWFEIYSELSESGTRMYDMLTARSEPQVLRVALIYALLDGQGEIGLDHLGAAREVVRYSNDSVRTIFGDATGNPIADAIIWALRTAPDGMSRSEISNNLFGRNVTADDIGSALALLCKYGMIRGERSKTTAGAGRPREVWFAVQ